MKDSIEKLMFIPSYKQIMKRTGLFIIFLIGYLFFGKAEVLPGKTYRINSLATVSKSLSVRNSSLNNKAEVVTWTQTSVNAQRWTVSSASTNYLYLTNAYSDKSLHYSNMRPKPGDRVEQDANDNSSYFQWEFVPVLNTAYPDTYFIRFCMKSGDNDLYLQQMDNVDGTNVTVQLKSTDADSLKQMWRVEEVTPIPNVVTQELRDTMMQGWKDYYYKQAPVGHIIGSGGWWGDAEMFETVLDGYETSGKETYKDMFTELYLNFTYRNKTDWLYNEYNDDIAWMVIVAARASILFDDGRYLNHAKSNFDKMYARALLPSGMLRWKETPANNQGTNSCINGPAEVAACYLAMATGDDTYYEKAKNLYALQRQYLYEPSTGKVFDAGVWDNGTFSIVNHWVSTYNQGTFLGAALMLYNRYSEDMYKNDAHKIVEWTRNDLCDSYGVIKVCGSGNDLQGFKGILMRYLRRYTVDLAQPDQVDWLQRNALHAFNNRNSKRISWTAWWEKSTENFVFSDGYNYQNQPFGSSTAISAAFNALLDKNRIIKDAYSTIEAEHFDYLKGVFVEEYSNEMVLTNIQNNYYTAYNNVNFGNETATTAFFSVYSNSTSGTIEIRLGSPKGQLIGTANIASATPDLWADVTCPIEDVTGFQNIYIVFKGNNFKIDNFQFKKKETGLDELRNQPKINIYPNPVSENLTIESIISGNLGIFNATGMLVYSKEIIQGTTSLNVSNFSSGYYFVKINASNESCFNYFLKK